MTGGKGGGQWADGGDGDGHDSGEGGPFLDIGQLILNNCILFLSDGANKSCIYHKKCHI